MPRQPPISAELWQRLARLDARCDFAFERVDTAPDGAPVGSNRYPRTWRVRVQLRGRGPRWRIAVEGPWLAPVLEDAVRAAERAGWAG